MKITTVSLSRTIPTGPYENVKVGMEATIEPGESEFDALNKLSQLISDWNAKQYRPVPEIVATVDMRTNGNPPPTIDIEKSDPSEYLAFIQNAPDMAALTSFKLIASSEKTLYNAYCQRLKELAHE